MKNFRADLNKRMLAIIQCRIFCLPVQYPKIQDQDIQKWFLESQNLLVEEQVGFGNNMST